MEKYLTKNQMSLIVKAGFPRYGKETDFIVDRKTYESYLSCPVDVAIDWLRKKYNIVIYNRVPPFVDPTAKKPCILYRFSVKWCNLRDGWNGRENLGSSKLTKNIYAAKRQATSIALKWLLKQNEHKTSKSTKSTPKKK